MVVRSRGVCAALALWWFSSAAQAGEHDVLALARLWSEVRATHPALAAGTIDWDRALVAALPHLEGEDNQNSLRAAAVTLMAPLHDDALRIGAAMPVFVRWPVDGAVLEWLPGDTALLHLHPGRALARRLNVRHAASFATSYQQLAMPYEAGHGAQLAYEDRLFPAPGPLYQGKVVMLIDEHTQSQAEHLALAVEAATPVTFVGTPSAGANGDLREVVLPGNVHVWYSGLEVRHADGRQLQRVGVQPHILAAPTVAGLRAGRDEVLERARQFLRQDQG